MKNDEQTTENKQDHKTLPGAKGRHKWGLGDECEKCGLERRWVRKAPNGEKGGFVFGRPSYEFYVDGEWKFAKVYCN